MIDSHAHVLLNQFDDDRDDVISRALVSGVTGWLEVGVDVESSKQVVAFAREHDGVYATVGVHPHDVAGMSEESWSALEELASDDVVKAIGEVGFDLHHGDNFEEQKTALIRFMSLAQKHDLPLVFHMRDGDDSDVHSELIDLLSSYSENERPRGVLHMFSGTVEQARQYIDLGMYISVSGVVTFKNAGVVVDVTRAVSLNRLLVETDCPFLAPEPHRGKRNEPAYVAFVADKVAELKGVSSEEVEKVTEKNTRELFGM